MFLQGATTKERVIILQEMKVHLYAYNTIVINFVRSMLSKWLSLILGFTEQRKGGTTAEGGRA